jgi:hypothetical protein
MKTLTLTRLEVKEAVIGVLVLEGKVVGFSLENLAYLLDFGTYLMSKYNSPKFGREVWKIKDTLIEIHNGNTIEDTTGCIIIGGRVGEFASSRGVMDSVKTLNLLMNLTRKDDELKLIVA